MAGQGLQASVSAAKQTSNLQAAFCFSIQQDLHSQNMSCSVLDY